MASPCYLVERWVEPQEAEYQFITLHADLSWLDVAGNRLEYWTNTFTQPYTYGQGKGIRTYGAQPDHVIIKGIRDRLETATGVFYEGCFLNYYRDGSDGIGWHSDDDPAIDHSKPIAVVTLGCGRRIEYKAREPGSHPVGQFLSPGSLFVMKPGMQQTHFHRIPKDDHAVGERISLTFRSLRKASS